MEVIQKVCPKLKCEKNPLVEVEIERTLVVRKFWCSKCNGTYPESTRLGKAAQVAPVVSAGVMFVGLAAKVATALTGMDDHGHAQHASGCFDD